MLPRGTNEQAKNPAAETLALQTLAWALADPARAQRLLDLTGLDPADLRARATEPAVLAATLSFLQAHQPDLLAYADALEITPEQLIAAQRVLGGETLS